MQRFFLPAECFESDRVSFPPETAHQLYHVLRMQPGAALVALDNQGSQFRIELEGVAPTGAFGRIVSRSPAEGEPWVHLALYVCLAQREKFEWILQKCTEAGAASFTPVVSSRSRVQDRADVDKKLARWEKIVREAAEQCERGRLPELYPALPFEAACRQASQDNHLALIPWEGERFSPEPRSLRQALTGLPGRAESSGLPPRVALIIGPEGGFSDDEVSLARQHGIAPVSLGPRVLRMETAAMIATAIVIDTVDSWPSLPHMP
jgi:16S rRNA (uracil1498-N3)-methyltransferase